MDTTMDYGKYFKNLTAKVEQETEYGVYVWKMPDGRYVGDGAGRYLSINSRQGDVKRMSMLTKEIRSYGIEDGALHYLPDRYKVTDGEYDSMMERMEGGTMADPADPGNLEGKA